MKYVLLVKTIIEHKDGKTCIREIKAAGYTDDSGRFRMTRCVGKIFTCSAAPSEDIIKTDRSVA